MGVNCEKQMTERNYYYILGRRILGSEREKQKGGKLNLK